MAGICGLIGFEPRAIDEPLVDRMVQRMPHRGGRVGRLRWREIRLAALDATAPRIWPAPGNESPRELFVVLDGTIDNRSELAADLLQVGLHGGASEAQIIAAGFRAEGPSFLKRLQGPFAAAISDPESETSWLVRDPVGMRPLYLHRTRSRILFASEIRPLLADPAVRLDLDPEQLRVLLTLGFNPAPHTLLQGIHKMPPGHYLRADRSGLKILRYDEIEAGSELDLSYEEAVEGYRTGLQRVVRRIATDNTGILLSGGADSSALLLLHTKEGRTATTYTAGFSGPSGEEDERLAAWQAARALGTLHRERRIEVGEFGSLIHAVARTVEEPVAAAWLPPFYRLLEVPEGQVSTLWSGQGAGVLHGEGEIWRWLQWGEWVAGLPEKVGGLVGAVARRVGGISRRYERSRLLAVREERERVLGSFFLFDDAELDRLLRAGHIGDRQTVRRLLDRWREPVADHDPLIQGLHIYRKTFLPDAIFLPADRLAAGSGLTLRFPYADAEIVQWLERLPASYRLDGEQGKRLHREALGAWLPAEVLTRRKQDLGYAVRRWVWGDGRARMADWLLGPSAWLPSVLDGVQVRALIDRAGPDRASLEPLILLVQLELWARETFLGGGR